MRLQKHIDIDKAFSQLKAAKLLVACSGGVDSVSLAHLLFTCGYDTALAHCNFSLRGKESDADEVFVKNFAKDLGVAVYTEQFDTQKVASENKLSIQMAARKLRYDWFSRLMDRHGFDYLLTAHHLNDNLETYLLNTVRGTGLRGLTGIPGETDKVIRPLLPFSKREIVRYAEENGLSWREDSSNRDDKYTRNKIRQKVVPGLLSAFPEALENFKTTQRHLKQSRKLVEDYTTLVSGQVMREIEDGWELDIKKLKQFPNHTALLYELLGPYGFKEWNDVAGLLGAQSGKQVFSGSHCLLKDRDRLLLKPVSEPVSGMYLIGDQLECIEEPVKIRFEPVGNLPDNFGSDAVYVDRDKLVYPLRLRRWQEGDVFFPFGLQGKKKVSKLFKDEKLSLLAKNRVWLLEDARRRIIWVVGMRVDDRFRVTGHTANILKIQIDIRNQEPGL